MNRAIGLTLALMFVGTPCLAQDVEVCLTISDAGAAPTDRDLLERAVAERNTVTRRTQTVPQFLREVCENGVDGIIVTEPLNKRRRTDREEGEANATQFDIGIAP